MYLAAAICLSVFAAPSLADSPQSCESSGGFVLTDGWWDWVRPHIPVRYQHSGVYDSKRHRMIVIGGRDGGSSQNDVWVLPLSGESGWEELEPVGTPPPLQNKWSSIYDPVGDRIVLHGSGETWLLTLDKRPTWSVFEPAGGIPPPRYDHTAIYDPLRKRMIVFGGKLGTTEFNDTWALSLGKKPTWSRIDPAGELPPARSAHSAIYDPVRDRMIVHAGEYRYSGVGETWALSLGDTPTWEPIQPQQGSVPRTGHVAVYDPSGDRMVVFGGHHCPGCIDILMYLDDAWALSLGETPTWTKLSPLYESPPIARMQHVGIYDPLGSRLITHGGYASSILPDTWSFDLAGTSGWELIAAANHYPPPRGSGAAVYDPVGDQTILIGGRAWEPGLSDVWSLNGSNDWSPLIPTGTAPGGFVNPSAFYDGNGERVIVFGRNVFNRAAPLLWSIWLNREAPPEWQAIATGPVELPFDLYSGQGISYDTRRERLIFTGTYSGIDLGEVWSIPTYGGVWEQIETTGPAPALRRYHGSVYDPVGDQVIIYGGQGVGSPGAGLGLLDTWVLDLGRPPHRWRKLEPTGPKPYANETYRMFHDPLRDRFLLFGYGVWALTMGDEPEWEQLEPAGLDYQYPDHPAIAYDTRRDRYVSFGGGIFPRYPPVLFGETWFLSFLETSEQVDIDVIPGNVENPIQVKSGRPIPVAVLSNPRFNATTLLLPHVTLSCTRPFEDGQGRPRSTLEDVDGDGRMDVVIYFRSKDLRLRPDETSIVLRGHTSDGLRIWGVDEITQDGQRVLLSEDGDGLSLVSPPVRLAIERTLPNPARSRFSVDLAIPGDEPVQIEIFNVAGRRVGTREFVTLKPGRQRITLGRTMRLAPGLYIIRATQGSQTASAKVAVIR
jgi:hypothetical protein